MLSVVESVCHSHHSFNLLQLPSLPHFLFYQLTKSQKIIASQVAGRNCFLVQYDEQSDKQKLFPPRSEVILSSIASKSLAPALLFKLLTFVMANQRTLNKDVFETLVASAIPPEQDAEVTLSRLTEIRSVTACPIRHEILSEKRGRKSISQFDPITQICTY